ncbi:kinase-like protein [Trametes sanguinea]|nr:kinase-like protein [Trametes sanguinea]
MTSVSSMTLEELKALLAQSAEAKIAGVDRATIPLRTDYDPRSVYAVQTVLPIDYGGTPLMVKFGTHVYPREADAMAYVASRTTIRIPRLYAVFTDSHPDTGRTVTYIVQERIPGTTLEGAWPTLTDVQREDIARELRDAYNQLGKLSGERTRLGPISGGWMENLYFRYFRKHFPLEDGEAQTTESFLAYFRRVRGRHTVRGNWTLDEFLAFFDLRRPPIFSHGDLSAWNVMVADGRLAAIIDWAEAGWYPYFWDSFCLRRNYTDYRLPGWNSFVDSLCEHFPEEDNFGIVWEPQADFYADAKWYA